MEKKKALLEFPVQTLSVLDSYANTKGISRNAAVNLAVSYLLEEKPSLISQIHTLQALAVKLAILQNTIKEESKCYPTS